MKIYIQQTTSERYIGHAGGWVPSIADARDFQRSDTALHFCFANRLSAVHIRPRLPTTASDVVWRVADALELPEKTYES